MLTSWSFGPSLIDVKDGTDELGPSNSYIYLPDLCFFLNRVILTFLEIVNNSVEKWKRGLAEFLCVPMMALSIQKTY